MNSLLASGLKASPPATSFLLVESKSEDRTWVVSPTGKTKTSLS
jgi:hypothetical protein